MTVRPSGPMTPFASTLHERYRRIAYRMRRELSTLRRVRVLNALRQARDEAYDDYVQEMEGASW